MTGRCGSGSLSGLSRAGCVLALVPVLLSAAACGPVRSATVPPPDERVVGVGFETVVDGRPAVGDLAGRLDAVRATGIGVSVGRVDWTAFPWAGHRDAWSAAVRETGRDYVAAAIGALQPAGGARRDVVLVVDTLLDARIRRDPEVAGVDASGRRSSSFPSITALTAGRIGEEIVALVAAVAGRYRPSAVSLTELFADTYTFGADDLADYRRFTDRPDWPRLSSGRIDVRDPSIARWRSAAIAGLVARAATAAHREGCRLYMEVRANWQDPAGDRAESGQDYGALLRTADRLVLWDYFGLNGRRPSYTEKLARAVQRRFPGRVVMSVGMWADDGTIPADDLADAVRASVRGGVRSVWVTPASLLGGADWAALRRVWTGG